MMNMQIISTNSSANSALRYLNAHKEVQTNTISNLGSGNRITTTNDAASLEAVGNRIQNHFANVQKVEISNASKNRFNADVNPLEQSLRDSFMTIGFAKEVVSDQKGILERMKELAIEDSFSSEEDVNGKALRSNEFENLKNLYNENNKQTDRMGQKRLFDGDFTLEIPGEAKQANTIRFPDLSSEKLGIDKLTLAGREKSIEAIEQLSNAITLLDKNSSGMTKVMEKLSTRLTAIQMQGFNVYDTSALDSQSAKMQIDLSSSTIKTQAANAVLSQANSMPQMVLNLLR